MTDTVGHERRYSEAVLAIEAYLWAFDSDDIYDEAIDLSDEVIGGMVAAGREIADYLAITG
ncbi:hypothetical protein LCGC14_1728850 [marine sediment metagenome]|uniref:Uncharacterized protein n=1 Tax=marine sediment metagenome TaxID=412755 RepID=A0A0F9HXZ7_9ZZZZ